MHLEIISPEGQMFSGEITSVTVPGTKGRFQVLKSHAPIVSILQAGDVTVRSDKGFAAAKVSDMIELENGNEFSFQVSSGVIKSQQNNIIILVD